MSEAEGWGMNPQVQTRTSRQASNCLDTPTPLALRSRGKPVDRFHSPHPVPRISASKKHLQKGKKNMSANDPRRFETAVLDTMGTIHQRDLILHVQGISRVVRLSVDPTTIQGEDAGPRQCPECFHLNPAGNGQCQQCGYLLVDP